MGEVMVDELQLIERLNGLRAILKTNTDLADVILLGMIEEAEQKVARFERDMQEEMFDNVPV
jgi:hypothetical protein